MKRTHFTFFYGCLILMLGCTVDAGGPSASGIQADKGPAGAVANSQEITSQTTGLQKSYMITNRSDTSSSIDSDIITEVYPLSNGEILFYTSDHEFDSTSANYAPTSGSNFLSQLGADLGNTSQNGVAQLTVFIHGLDSPWDSAYSTLGKYSQRLNESGYQGIVVGFSWPSYGEISSGLFYSDSYLPSSDSLTIRNNIRGSEEAFSNMLDTLFSLKNDSSGYDSLCVNIIAHSEGNYMLLRGMNYIDTLANPLQGNQLDQIIMMAADINNGALDTPACQQNVNGASGDGGAIAEHARFVTFYYSSHDPDLEESGDFYKKYHNPNYTERLGYFGAHDNDSLASNVAAVSAYYANPQSRLDSLIDNDSIPSYVSVHTSYLYVKDFLDDTALTLSNNATSGQNIGERVEAHVSIVGTAIPNLFCLIPTVYPPSNPDCYSYNP